MSVDAVPNSSWLRHLLSRALHLSRRFNPQDLSMLLWAIATLSEAAGSGGSSAFTRQHQHHNQTAPASLVLGRGGARAATQRSAPHELFPSTDHTLPPLSPPLLSSAGRHPAQQLPPGFLRAMLDSAESRMEEFGAQALSNTLWALAKLRCRPDDGWLDRATLRMEASSIAL